MSHASQTSAELAQASTADTLAFLGEVGLPTFSKGAIVRRPGMVGLSERLDLDGRAVRRMQRLRAKYGQGPLLLRTPIRKQALILSPDHVRYVLENAPEPFAPATAEKRAALAHFEPRVSLASHGEERYQRRRFNEEVLQWKSPVHALADPFMEVVDEEAERLLSGTDTLDWDSFIIAWYRIVRRVVLGDAAADDHELTDLLTTLRGAANWAFLHPGRSGTLERFHARLNDHLGRAEDNSLAGLIARRPAQDETAPADQVDKTGWTDLGFLRACVLESLRLWPTTPAIFRETTTETEWNGGTMPANTHLLIFAPFFHRDEETLPEAHLFAPEIWYGKEGEAHWPLVPFSGGPGRCPASCFVPMLTSAALAAILSRRRVRLEPPDRLGEDRPMPAILDNYSLRFRLEPNP